MSKMKENMVYLGLNPKKEIKTLILISIILCCSAFATWYFLKQLVLAIMLVVIDVVFILFFLTRYTKKIEAINNENLQEFAVIFGYFKIYIRNGFSVYSSLKEILPFANSNMKILLEELIKEIDQDKSVQPFVKFAKHFNEIIVEEMMISIYQMIDDGEQSDYLLQFELIFDKFSELLHQKNLRNKDTKLGTLGSTPLIGSCFLIIILTIGIIGILGEVINGI